MRASSALRRRRSKPVKEQSFPISNFGKCVIALAPVKPAMWLSQKVGCSERHANFLIAGKRKVNARALVVLMDEID